VPIEEEEEGKEDSPMDVRVKELITNVSCKLKMGPSSSFCKSGNPSMVLLVEMKENIKTYPQIQVFKNVLTSC
jgi:hypothetical protein